VAPTSDERKAMVVFASTHAHTREIAHVELNAMPSHDHISEFAAASRRTPGA
jgi:hypothetical protein